MALTMNQAAQGFAWDGDKLTTVREAQMLTALLHLFLMIRLQKREAARGTDAVTLKDISAARRETIAWASTLFPDLNVREHP